MNSADNIQTSMYRCHRPHHHHHHHQQQQQQQQQQQFL